MAMTVNIRAMREDDLPAVMEICREAWRALLKIPDKMVPAADNLRTRFLSAPEMAIVADLDGKVVGSNFVARWGSVAVIGPVTVRPTGWTGGAGKLLLEGSVELARRAGFENIAGYTFSDSPGHLQFFNSVGIWPRFLTMILARSVRPGARPAQVELFSELSEAGRAKAIADTRALTETLVAGMDLQSEFDRTQRFGVGDGLFLRTPEGALEGFAVVHWGPGSEARVNTGYVRFGQVLPGPEAPARFRRLLDACEWLSAERGQKGLALGMNLSEPQAFQVLSERRYLPLEQGVAMHWRNDPLYKIPGVWVIDDWR